MKKKQGDGRNNEMDDEKQSPLTEIRKNLEKVAISALMGAITVKKNNTKELFLNEVNVELDEESDTEEPDSDNNPNPNRNEESDAEEGLRKPEITLSDKSIKDYPNSNAKEEINSNNFYNLTPTATFTNGKAEQAAKPKSEEQGLERADAATGAAAAPSGGEEQVTTNIVGSVTDAAPDYVPPPITSSSNLDVESDREDVVEHSEDGENNHDGNDDENFQLGAQLEELHKVAANQAAEKGASTVKKEILRPTEQHSLSNPEVEKNTSDNLITIHNPNVSSDKKPSIANQNEQAQAATSFVAKTIAEATATAVANDANQMNMEASAKQPETRITDKKVNSSSDVTNKSKPAVLANGEIDDHQIQNTNTEEIEKAANPQNQERAEVAKTEEVVVNEAIPGVLANATENINNNKHQKNPTGPPNLQTKAHMPKNEKPAVLDVPPIPPPTDPNENIGLPPPTKTRRTVGSSGTMGAATKTNNVASPDGKTAEAAQAGLLNMTEKVPPTSSTSTSRARTVGPNQATVEPLPKTVTGTNETNAVNDRNVPVKPEINRINAIDNRRTQFGFSENRGDRWTGEGGSRPTTRKKKKPKKKSKSKRKKTRKKTHKK